MRIVRSIGVILVAAALAINLSACQLIEGGNKPSVQIENMPEGEWTAGGDLCKIITAETVTAMFNQGPLTSRFDQAYFDSGKSQAIDFCSYVDASTEETMIELSARKLTDQEQATFRPEAEALTGTPPIFTEYTVAGIDEAFYASYEAFVRKGNMAAGVQAALESNFDNADKLVELAAMVVILVS